MSGFIQAWLKRVGFGSGLGAGCAMAVTMVMAAPAAQAQTPAQAPVAEKPVVVFIATGGTIAMKVDPVTKGVVPAISGDDLMQSVPDASKYARIEVNNFSKMSANYITNDWWARLTKTVEQTLARPEVAGVVVAQGTDTMEETAYWLDLTVKSSKPVVLIGAQRNASSPDFDGPRNLLNAIRIAVTPAQASGVGVPHPPAHDGLFQRHHTSVAITSVAHHAGCLPCVAKNTSTPLVRVATPTAWAAQAPRAASQGAVPRRLAKALSAQHSIGATCQVPERTKQNGAWRCGLLRALVTAPALPLKLLRVSEAGG